MPQELVSELVYGHRVEALTPGHLALTLNILNNCRTAAADDRIFAVDHLLPYIFELAGQDALSPTAWRSVCSAILGFMAVCCARRLTLHRFFL